MNEKYPQSNGIKNSSLQLIGRFKSDVCNLCFSNKLVFLAAVKRLVSKPKIISAFVSSPSSFIRPKIPIEESIPINSKSQLQTFSNSSSILGPGPQSETKLS